MARKGGAQLLQTGEKLPLNEAANIQEAAVALRLSGRGGPVSGFRLPRLNMSSIKRRGPRLSMFSLREELRDNGMCSWTVCFGWK